MIRLGPPGSLYRCMKISIATCLSSAHERSAGGAQFPIGIVLNCFTGRKRQIATSKPKSSVLEGLKDLDDAKFDRVNTSALLGRVPPDHLPMHST